MCTGEGAVPDRLGKPLGEPAEPLRRPGAGTAVALAVFAFVSWWGLWSPAVEHTAAPNGFDWLASLALAGIAVSRWLARYGAERLIRTPPRKAGLFDSGDAFSIGFVLIVPGGACWFAVRAVLAQRRKARNRLGYSALWLLWALAGTTGQVIFPWSADLTPSIVFFAACMLNVAAIAALMFLEPTSKPHAVRHVRVADGATC
jgi:hypothetical protein